MVFLLLIALLAWIVLGTWGLVRLAKQPPAVSIGIALAHDRPTDPGEARCTWSDIELRTNDGLALPMWRVDGDSPTGPTLIVLHDWGSSPVAHLDELAALTQHASVVLMPTLRGHASQTGRCSLGPRELDDVATLLATIDGDVVIHGTGLGGLLAKRLQGTSAVTQVVVHRPWANAQEGISLMLTQRGQIAFPFAWLARICLPS
jgi:hypothetical protein